MHSEEIRITLPDGRGETRAQRDQCSGRTRKGKGIPDGWVSAKLNGQMVDLTRKINEDAVIEGIEARTEAGLEILRHSAAHIMAQA